MSNDINYLKYENIQLNKFHGNDGNNNLNNKDLMKKSYISNKVFIKIFFFKFSFKIFRPRKKAFCIIFKKANVKI